MVTYANDGNVLDVVVGHHDVGLVVGKLVSRCKPLLLLWLCSGMMLRTKREVGRQYLCIMARMAGTRESGPVHA
jgi:hypothetical protein